MFELTRIVDLYARSDAPYETPELLARAFIPVFVALAVFYVGMKLQYKGSPAWIKWLAVLPLIVGILLGIDPFNSYFIDPLYRDVYGGGNRRMIFHAAGLIVPVIGAAGMAFWSWWLNRQKFEDL